MKNERNEPATSSLQPPQFEHDYTNRKEITYTTKNGTKRMHTHHKSCKIRNRQKKIDDFQRADFFRQQLKLSYALKIGYGRVNKVVLLIAVIYIPMKTTRELRRIFKCQ
ncbi:unnamed protein product [Lactuca virosa]|uniref:Uncharacterized protein n=1 Tax=Lactuca virosa TaxID=75947 RepID=A0AAU9MWW8_9ASTR|nr:unnamed protein product [Lactuca virosa]